MATWLERHLENTLRLHREIRKSGIDSGECDEIRDHLDTSWKQLTESECDIVGEISELINEIEDRENVLMRVIENMHSEICGWNEVGDYPSPTDSIGKYIADAEAELAKERGA